MKVFVKSAASNEKATKTVVFRPGAFLAGATALPQAVLGFLCVLATGRALISLSAGPYSGILMMVLWVLAFGSPVLVWIYVVGTAFICAALLYATGIDAAAGLMPDGDYAHWLAAVPVFTVIDTVTAVVAFTLPPFLELKDTALFTALGGLALAAIGLRGLSALRFAVAHIVKKCRVGSRHTGG